MQMSQSSKVWASKAFAVVELQKPCSLQDTGFEKCVENMASTQVPSRKRLRRYDAHGDFGKQLTETPAAKKYEDDPTLEYLESRTESLEISHSIGGSAEASDPVSIKRCRLRRYDASASYDRGDQPEVEEGAFHVKIEEWLRDIDL